MICHLEVVIDEVDHEVGVPRFLSLRLKQAAEELQALLSKVISKDLEGHEIAVLAETLSEECKTQVLNVIVCHI